MFPNIGVNQYANVFNQINLAASRRVMHCDVSITELSKPFLRILQDLGYIRRFYRLHGMRYRFLIAFSKWRVKPRLWVAYVRPNHGLRLKLRALKILNITAGDSHFLLSTDKGLITHTQALKYRIGGRLIAVIY